MERNDFRDEELLRSVLRLHGHVLGLVLGTIVGLGVFIATNWLLIKGGERIGPHLALLGQYFIGYKVSFLGSLAGLAYGFVVGYVIGWVIALVYNRIVFVRHE